MSHFWERSRRLYFRARRNRLSRSLATARPQRSPKAVATGHFTFFRSAFFSRRRQPHDRLFKCFTLAAQITFSWPHEQSQRKFACPQLPVETYATPKSLPNFFRGDPRRAPSSSIARRRALLPAHAQQRHIRERLSRRPWPEPAQPVPALPPRRLSSRPAARVSAASRAPVLLDLLDQFGPFL